MAFPWFFLCDKSVNGDYVSRHVDRVQFKMLRREPPVIRFPAMRSSISVRVEMARQDIPPVATANVADGECRVCMAAMPTCIYLPDRV
jgi:hypothetical protein